MKIILSGGGTGGHIYPALAIADGILKKYPESEVLFVGTERGMESNLVPKAGYNIQFLDVDGIKREICFSNLKAIWKALKSTREGMKIIKEFQPDAVLGTGGYVCYPIVAAAHKMGIYTALHESNAIPGMAVKALKNRVDRIFVNFRECGEELNLPGKIMRVGNPMHMGGVKETREKLRDTMGITGKYRYCVLSFGGSLGAKTVNNAVISLISEMAEKRKDVLFVHACGKNYYNEFISECEEKGLTKLENVKLSEYIYDMPKWLRVADVVISRCGAVTLSEIAFYGRAAILLPSPNVVDNHQFKNAKAFADGGAAFVLDERAMEEEKISQYVTTLLEDKNLRSNMEKNAKKFAFDNSSEIITTEIAKGIRNKRIKNAENN